jgi:hypothetical protein
MWIFFSFYRRPSHWKFGEKKQLPFTCEEGSQKVFLQIMKSKISLKEDATEGVKFLFLSKSGIIIALGDVNHHLWKQLTQTNKHTHTHTHRAHFQRKLSVVQLSLGSSSRYGALKRKRLLVSCKSSSISWTVPQSSSLWYEQDLPGQGGGVKASRHTTTTTPSSPPTASI